MDYSGIMVEASQTQDRVMQGLWTKEGAVAAKTATIRVLAKVITLSMGQQLRVLQ